MNNYKEIQISRSQFIETDRAVAVIRLNEGINHLVGQPVMVRYYTDSSKTSIDCILAIGVSEGYGSQNYRIISAGQPWIIRDVVYIEPDVSMLVNNESYLFLDDRDNRWYLVTLNVSSGERVFTLLEGGPYKFLSIEDNYIWYFKEGILRKEDDFVTKSEVESTVIDIYSTDIEKLKETDQVLLTDVDDLKERVEDLEEEVYKLDIIFEQVSSDVIYLKGYNPDITYRVAVTRKGIDITSSCVFTFNSQIVSVTGGTFMSNSISASGEYKLVVRYEPTSQIEESYVTLEFGYPLYFGKVNKDWIATSDNILNLSSDPMISDSQVFLELPSSVMSQEKIAISIPHPDELGPSIKKIIDTNSMNYIDSYTVIDDNININSIRYITYLLTREISLHSFEQSIIFLNTINPGISEFTSEYGFEFY